MIKIGAHMQFSKSKNYFFGAIKEAIDINANTFMIFLGPPQSSKRVGIENFEIERVQKEGLFKLISPSEIIVHGPYIVNPASLTSHDFVVEFLTKECKTAEEIGIKVMVVHPGSSLKGSKDLAISNCAKTIKKILNNTQKIEIAIEMMSGRSGEIGVTLEEIKQIIDLVDSPRIKVCLDTCHAWNAGYNLDEIDNFLEEFDKKIGLSLLRVIHLNDSMTPKNSRRDRHANIGNGHIGLKLMRNIVRHPKLENVNMILETPWVDGKSLYREEISMLLEK